jgi:LysR family transcriptional regulator, transcriptional activator of nhaA
MEWLNYHHLLYFWTVAKEGGLKQASAKLHVSQPSISAQLQALEGALGQPLFRRSGRRKVLTDAGQVAYRYAEEIFTLGRELMNTLEQRPTARALRLYAGVADSFPKLVTHEILKPVFAMPQTVHVICREGKVEDLLGQLAAHRLDLVLSDEPAPSNLPVKTFNHLLGECGVYFCAAARLAARLRRGFPRSLHGAPALLPTENTAFRRALDGWFQSEGLAPRALAEFEDAALMKVMAADGQGFIALPSLVAKEAQERYGFQRVGTTEKCRAQFYAISAERRVTHPAVLLITARAHHPATGYPVKSGPG